MIDTQTARRRQAIMQAMTKACTSDLSYAWDMAIFDQCLSASGFYVAPVPPPNRRDPDEVIRGMGEAIATMHNGLQTKDAEIYDLKIKLRDKTAALMRAESRVAPEGFLRVTKEKVDGLAGKTQALLDEICEVRVALGRTASEQREGPRRGRGGFGSRG